MSTKQYLDFEGLSELIQELRKELKNEKVLSYDSIFQFPTIGKDDTLYIDNTDNMSYRWNDDDLKYYVVGFNPDELEIINGGNSEKSKE